MVDTYSLFCFNQTTHSERPNSVNSYVPEYASSLESLVNAVAPDKLSIVVQVLLVMEAFMNPSL